MAAGSSCLYKCLRWVLSYHPVYRRRFYDFTRSTPSLFRRPLVLEPMEAYAGQIAIDRRRKQIQNPPPKRGQVKARIFRSIGRSVAGLASKAAVVVVGGSPLISPSGSCAASAYSSDYSVDS
ncbi:unnamed protein product [Victoria cruziana]